MDNANLISLIAAIFTTLSLLPQAFKTVKTRDTKAISFWMGCFLVIGSVFWLIFGIMISNIPIILQNIITFFSSGTVLGIKTYHIIKNDEGKIGETKPVKKLKKLLR
jgi:MtN3 and saliva related transmembrane protein